MADLILRKEWPGFPAGTVLKFDGGTGRYLSEKGPNGQLWFEQSAISQNLFDFEVVGAKRDPVDDAIQALVAKVSSGKPYAQEISDLKAVVPDGA